MTGDGHAARADLPDVLIGVGGAGKRIVYECMETEWILTEALDPRGDGPPPGIEAFVVDTDGVSDDDARADAITDDITHIAERFGSDLPILSSGLTSVDLLPADRFSSPAALAAPTVVRHIAERSGLRAWWLDDAESLLESYHQGLDRRRALGKAIYHAGVADDDPLAPVVEAAAGSADVAIVVGLGGGTGSGVLLDLARRLDNARVDLFAVLPGIDERAAVRANAHATLSELEHLSRTGQNPFGNVVLLPFGAADDTEAFDAAAARTIAAHGDLPANAKNRLDPATNSGPPTYAPFTLAVPRTLRYAVDDIALVREEVETFLVGNQAAHDAEKALYDELETLLREADDEVADALGGRSMQPSVGLESDTAFELRERFDSLRELLDSDAVAVLDSDAAVDWLSTLDQFVDAQLQNAGDDPVDRAEALVTDLDMLTARLDPVDTCYPDDELDQPIDQFVRDELTTISRRAALYRTLPLFDDELAFGVEAAMDTETRFAPSLRETRDECAEALEALETDTDLAEGLRIDAETVAFDEMSEWATEVEPAVETVVTIDSHRDELAHRLSDLEAEVDTSLRRIEDADRPSELDRIEFGFDAARGLGALLDDVDASGIPLDIEAIDRSLRGLARAKRAKLEAEQVGLIGDLLFDRTDECRARFEDARRTVDADLFDVDGGFDTPLRCSFAVDVQDVLERVHDRREAAVGHILDEFEHRLIHPPFGQEQFDFVADEWAGQPPAVEWPGDIEGAVSDLRRYLDGDFAERTADGALGEAMAEGSDRDERGPVNAGFHAAVVGPLDELLDDLRAERESVERRYERLERLDDIVLDEGAQFADAFVPNALDVSLSTGEDDPYLVMTEPDDRGVVDHDSLVDADVLLSESERLAHYLDAFAADAAALADRLPLVEGVIEANAPVGVNGTYDGHRIVPVFAGPAFDEVDPSELGVANGVEATLRDAIGAVPGQSGYHADTCPFGAPWDTSLVTFVGGVFLDNLQPVRDPGGYADAYERQRNDLGDGVRSRHAHGLDGCDSTLVDEPGVSAFVVRDRLLDLHDPDEVADFVDATDDERRDLFDEYTTTETFESTVELDADD